MGDPLKDMPQLPTHPPETFIPTGRYTKECKEIIDKIHLEDFLWLQEQALMHEMMHLQEKGFTHLYDHAAVTLLVSHATDSCLLIRSLITHSLQLYTLFTYYFQSFMHCLLTLIVVHMFPSLFIGFMHGYGWGWAMGLEIEVEGCSKIILVYIVVVIVQLPLALI